MQTTLSKRDSRQYKRVPVDWVARFCVNGTAEHQTTLRDVSGGGMALNSSVCVRVGDHVIVYADSERFEGYVVRQLQDGFAIELSLHKPKRQRLLAKLMWHMNADIISDDDDLRGMPRLRSQNLLSPCHLADGTEVYCRVLDMTIVSANIEAQVQPPVGSYVRIGQVDGEVVRHTMHGFVVLFTGETESEALRYKAEAVTLPLSSSSAVH